MWIWQMLRNLSLVLIKILTSRPCPSIWANLANEHQIRKECTHFRWAGQHKGYEGLCQDIILLGCLVGVNRKQSCFCHRLKCSLFWMRVWAGLIFHLMCSTIEVHICTSLPHLHPHTRCTYTFRNTETFLVSHGVHAVSLAGSCII